jgi:hypothetical protein
MRLFLNIALFEKCSSETIKSKVVNALRVGGTEAFKEAVNHPLLKDGKIHHKSLKSDRLRR